ncbi:MAG TPA: c-type cytochrome [Candidatus Didemnitutus sp.]|nr:c-type cytochrome [Candidatus Didemnitutus sp.]
MRIAFKILGYLLLVLLIVVIGGGAWVMMRSSAALKQKYTVKVRPITIPKDAAAIEHGAHIARTRGCIDCHGADFGGKMVIEDFPMGQVYAPNLTRGHGGSVTAFQDEDWIRAVRHGIGFDGHGLFIMPAKEYSHFSDEDLGALVAFLKQLPPVNREPLRIRPGPVSRVLLTVSPAKMIGAAAIDHASLAPVAVAKAATKEYGRYLAEGCIGCHGPNFSGGKIEVGPPDWPKAANLTPHPEGHLSKWSEADFIATIRTAKRPDGTALDPVMPRGFAGMDDVELKALWAFFQSLPPVAQGVR